MTSDEPFRLPTSHLASGPTVPLQLLPVLQAFLHPIFRQATILVVGVLLAICELSIAVSINHAEMGRSSRDPPFSISSEIVRAGGTAYLFG